MSLYTKKRTKSLQWNMYVCCIDFDMSNDFENMFLKKKTSFYIQLILGFILANYFLEQ